MLCFCIVLIVHGSMHRPREVGVALLDCSCCSVLSIQDIGLHVWALQSVVVLVFMPACFTVRLLAWLAHLCCPACMP